MAVYDDYGAQLPVASITVHQDTRAARVTYHDEAGKAFRVLIVQKPNPIGFTARLPGDRRK